MQETKSLTQSARNFFSGTFLSRLTGFGRDLVMAVCFGATPAVAAFMVAFRFANLARRLLGESPLASSFIPHFESLKEESPQKAHQFFCDLFLTLALLLAGFIIPLMLFLPSTEVALLTKLMLPGLFFVCLYGLSSAFLQCHEKMFRASAAPVAFNLIWIIAAYHLRFAQNPMPLLAMAVVVGFSLQWLVCMGPILEKISWETIKAARPFSLQVRVIMAPFALGILGVGASQINNALDALFARWASLEGPAYLWYAMRLEQLPLVLFGIAWSAALLPALSKNKTLALLRHAIEKCALFLIPVTALLIPCGAAGVNFLFGHGDFTPEAVYQTSLCLWGYGLGLFPSALVFMLSAYSFAHKNYRLPSKAAGLTVILNVLLNSFMVFILHLGPLSIALATSISQIFNAVYLSCHIKPFTKPLVKQLALLAFISFSAGLLATLLYPDPIFLEGNFSRDLIQQFMAGVLPLAVFIACVGISLKLLKKA